MARTSEFLGRLQGVKKTGQSKWIACCPAHGDKSPSLAVRADGDKLLVHCFAGCAVDDVVSAVGMCLSDLMPDRLDGFRSRASGAPSLSAYDLFPAMAYKALYIADCVDAVLAEMESLGVSVDGGFKERLLSARESVSEMASAAGIKRKWVPVAFRAKKAGGGHGS